MSQYVLVWRKTEQNVNVAVHFLSAVFTPLVLLILSGEDKNIIKKKEKRERLLAIGRKKSERLILQMWIKTSQLNFKLFKGILLPNPRIDTACALSRSKEHDPQQVLWVNVPLMNDLMSISQDDLLGHHH